MAVLGQSPVAAVTRPTYIWLWLTCCMASTCLNDPHRPPWGWFASRRSLRGGDLSGRRM